MIKIAMHNGSILAKPSAMKAGIILHTCIQAGHSSNTQSTGWMSKNRQEEENTITFPLKCIVIA